MAAAAWRPVLPLERTSAPTRLHKDYPSGECRPGMAAAAWRPVLPLERTSAPHSLCTKTIRRANAARVWRRRHCRLPEADLRLGVGA